MAASDDLTKLADRAEAEERVAAAREKGKADIPGGSRLRPWRG